LDDIGSGFLKTEVLVVGSNLDFLASVSSGVSSVVVVVRFLLIVAKIDGLNESKIIQNELPIIEMLTEEFFSFQQ
jgi:hypothetical protein